MVNEVFVKPHPDLQAVIEAQNGTKEGLCMPLLPYQTDYAAAYADLLKKMLTTETGMTAEQAYNEMVKLATDAIELYFLSAGIVL